MSANFFAITVLGRLLTRGFCRSRLPLNDGHLTTATGSFVLLADITEIRVNWAILPLETSVSRRKKDPLRSLTEHELQSLQQISPSHTAPAVAVVRAKMLLLIATGSDYQDAVHAVGRRSREAASLLVARFNQEGLAALPPRHGGGRQPVYGQKERQRILTELARTPTPEYEGGATWSLATLQKALRTAPDGLPTVSTYTVWQVLRENGQTHQHNRTWCQTGTVLRKRKEGTLTVTDPDTV